MLLLNYTMLNEYGRRSRDSFLAFLFQSSFLYFGGVFNKTIVPLALVEYEMIIANSATRTLPAICIYHFISDARSRNNC